MVLAGFGLAVGLIAVTARHEVRSAKAQWAADAAALAAASVGVGVEGGANTAGGGHRVAAAVAEANGADLLAVSVVDGDGAPVGRSAESRFERNSPISGGSGQWPVVVVRVDYRGVPAAAAAQRFTARNP